MTLSRATLDGEVSEIGFERSSGVRCTLFSLSPFASPSPWLCAQLDHAEHRPTANLNLENPDPACRPSSFCKLDAELLALEGAPSVSAALRALHESPSSPDTPAPPSAVRAAAELLLAYVTNALRDPRNPRVHRVRSGNPAFQRALGRLGGCEAAMTAVGFEPRDRGAVFVLRELGAGAAVGRASAAKEREEVSVSCPWVARTSTMVAGDSGSANPSRWGMSWVRPKS